MSSLKIRKVGNSLGVIFPKEIQETLNISEGDLIDVTTSSDHTVTLHSHLPHHSQWKFEQTSLNAEDIKWLDAELENDDEL